jgi:hypothetical protein
MTDNFNPTEWITTKEAARFGVSRFMFDWRTGGSFR